jgi:predicted ATPase/DNA-binding winged helix-turn-helix (wHTH) protein
MAGAVDNSIFTFGPFHLSPEERLLLEDEKPLPLGSRALELLITLVERAGETVLKDQLIGRVWPDTAVEEGVLRVYVAALRKALGDGRDGNRFIVNIPGRGYRFVAPVTREHREPTAPPRLNRPVRGGNLPGPLARVIGRSDIISMAVSRVSRHRLLTIVGPGGIGKTTVAVAAAEAIRASYADGAWFVGLATLLDPALVPEAVRAALDLPSINLDPLSALIACLRDKHMLIVLDCCEHVVGAVAGLAEAVLRAAPRLSILVTSREPLRVEGEWLLRLPSLSVPSGTAPPTTTEALTYSAVQLFSERATAAMDGFVLSDADIPDAVEICRALDGVPLALELAAARVEVFGVKGLAAQLQDRLAVLTRGRRTALPHHQSLRAAIDWSYNLLSAAEQMVLRHVAVFTGDFSLDGACAAAAGNGLTAADVVEAVANLAMKSLIAADISGETTLYRLLDTTRLYALDQLRSGGEFARAARRHAEYHCSVFANAEAESEARPQAEWLAIYGRHLDNVRAALDWAFSQEGDTEIGVAVAAAVVPLWVQLSLMGECRERVERALVRVNSVPNPNPRHQMLLYTALGMSLNYTTGPVSETATAWTNTLIIAKSLDETEYQLRALRGLWAHHMNAGEYRRALGFAREFRRLAEAAADPVGSDFGNRMAAIILHYLGDQKGARGHLEHGFAGPAAPVRHWQTARFLLDRDVTVQALSSRILWLQGFPEQAVRTAQLAVNRALAIGHALSLCHALGQAACPLALYTGDLEGAEGSVAMLLDNARECGLAGWTARGHCFQGMLMIARDDFAGGLPMLRNALAELRKSGAAPSYPAFLAILAGGLGRAGRVTEGLASIDEALMLTRSHEEHWCLPELMRTMGELRLLEDSRETVPSAEDYFRQALDRAHRDRVLAWELRAATSLARLWRGQGRRGEARELLAPLYGSFTEGFDTQDLKEAKALLEELAA